MLVEGLYLLLSTNSSLQALLGTTTTRKDSTTGMFSGLLPEEVPMPALVYQQIAGEPLQTSMEGTGRLTTTRWRFTRYGSTYKQARTLGKVLNLVMIGINGPLPGPDAKADVHGVWLKLDADDAEAIPHGTLYANHRDYEIVYLDYDDA